MQTQPPVSNQARDWRTELAQRNFTVATVGNSISSMIEDRRLVELAAPVAVGIGGLSHIFLESCRSVHWKKSPTVAGCSGSGSERFHQPPPSA